MVTIIRFASFITIIISLSACGGGGTGGNTDTGTSTPDTSGTDPMGDATSGTGGGDGGHDHNEVDLGTVKIGEHEVICAQGHGNVAAGKLVLLVVKLPYSDQGQTVVRAWIGTSDRNDFEVAKGIYAASHDDYDIHVNAPDPLPDGAQWWIEITGPDRPVVTGSIDYL